MPFYPYLHFQGECEAAMTFYAGIFGGAEIQIMRYSQAPEGMAPPSDLIMHSQFGLGDGVLMASDTPPGQGGGPQQSVSVMAAVKDAIGVFERLAEGAAGITVPFGPTFWSPGFGMLKDRYGTHWIISELTDAAPQA